MEQYIPKSALVAEIERRKSQFMSQADNFHSLGMEEKRDHFAVLASNMHSILSFIDTLEVKEVQEEPVSEELFEASAEYAATGEILANGKEMIDFQKQKAFIAGAEWKKNHLWKPADSDDLPNVDREVIALLNNGKVVFAHRPPEYWDGKDIITGKVTRNYVERYDKGLWNIPNVKWWLDVDKLPNVED